MECSCEQNPPAGTTAMQLSVTFSEPFNPYVSVTLRVLNVLAGLNHRDEYHQCALFMVSRDHGMPWGMT